MIVVRGLPTAILCAAVMTTCIVTLSVAGDTVRMVSYNIHHCEGMDGKVDCKRTAAAILREKPDFVGVQEVDRDVPRSGRADQPAELSRLTGMHVTFAKAIPYRGGEYGVAVLSHERPLSVKQTALPGPEPRVLLLCEFQNCWFGSTHLDSGKRRGDTEPCHVQSARIIRAEVAKCAATKPVFLAGDWNAVPGSPAHTEMCSFLKVVSDEKKPANGNLRRVIDYLAVDAAHAGDFKVLSAEVTIDHMTSDHKPVIVTLERVDDKPPSHAPVPKPNREARRNNPGSPPSPPSVSRPCVTTTPSSSLPFGRWSRSSRPLNRTDGQTCHYFIRRSSFFICYSSLPSPKGAGWHG